MHSRMAGPPVRVEWIAPAVSSRTSAEGIPQALGVLRGRAGYPMWDSEGRGWSLQGPAWRWCWCWFKGPGHAPRCSHGRHIFLPRAVNPPNSASGTSLCSAAPQGQSSRNVGVCWMWLCVASVHGGAGASAGASFGAGVGAGANGNLPAANLRPGAPLHSHTSK